MLIQSAKDTLCAFNTLLERWTLVCYLGNGIDNPSPLPSKCGQMATAISGSSLGHERFELVTSRPMCPWSSCVVKNLLSVNWKQQSRVACAVSFTRKIPIRKGGRLVAIATRNICSSQLENRWGKIFLKGLLAHEISVRELGFSKEDLRG